MLATKSSFQPALAWRQILIPFISALGNLGILTFNNLLGPSPFFKVYSIISLINGLPGSKSASKVKSKREKPIELMPSKEASIAADIVPEYKILMATLDP